MPPNFGNRPLGPLQRNWLNFLRHNPGPYFVALSKRDLRIAESLQARGLITLAPAEISSDGPNAVFSTSIYVLEAV